MLRTVLSLAAMLALATMAQAQVKKPPLPPGRDPGGIAVALIGTGVDYTLLEVARGLARDGEGDLIGLDLVDNDNRPLGDGGGTRLAVALLDKEIGARLVPVRAALQDPTSLARAAAFIARTPARLAVVALSSRRAEDWQPFRQAAERSPQLLFVVAAGDDGRDLDREPEYPAGLGLANVLVVTAAILQEGEPRKIRLLANANWGAGTVDAVALAADSLLAASVAAKAAAALLAEAPSPSGAELKQRLIRSALLQLEAETPKRTRSPAVLAPMVLRNPVGDPAERILDKARVPERMREPDRREPGKTR
jgi:hypothetical protein